MFQVIVTDLDGTLLDSHSRVDPFTASTLREVEALGLTFVLATSRHYLDACRFREAMGIGAYLITANGARAHDPGGTRILAEDIDPAVARALMRLRPADGTLVGMYVDTGWWVNRPCPEINRYFRGSGFAAEVRDLASHDGEGVAKVMYVGGDDLPRLEAEILDRFGESVCAISTGAGSLEIMALAASKSRALAEILDLLGVPASGCVAFGDGDNDIDVLSMVGRPFVMSRSSPKLLAALPGATSAGGNDDAGVARTLRGLLRLTG